MERRTFEDSLKDAFKDAEATPSDRVWTNVELELEKAKTNAIGRRLAFYQMLAAAAVSIALLSAGVTYFIVNDKDRTIEQLVAQSQQKAGDDVNKGALAQKSDNHAAPSDGSSTSEVPQERSGVENQHGIHDNSESAQPSANSIASIDESNPTVSKGRKENVSSTTSLNVAYGGGDRSVSPANENAVAFESSEAQASELIIARERALPSFYKASVRPLSFQQSTPDPVALMMSKLAEQEMLLASVDEHKAKEQTQEKVWTALGVAAGGFSAVSHSTAQAQSNGFAFASMNNSKVADKQSKASGVAYSLGLSFGTKVAPRWVLQGGLNYLTQSSNYVATNVIASPDYSTLKAESINALGKLPALADAASSDRLAPTVPYSVNNSLKYFSLPVQAGYLLVNRKFGVQLNAGISTDLFLENTITPEGGSLDKTTQGNGSDSPYRTVNFSGLMGTEFSYRLGQRYRIALNPALRYPLNSVYKSDVGIESAPLTFDVGLRFRYIFK